MKINKFKKLRDFLKAHNTILVSYYVPIFFAPIILFRTHINPIKNMLSSFPKTLTWEVIYLNKWSMNIVIPVMLLLLTALSKLSFRAFLGAAGLCGMFFWLRSVMENFHLLKFRALSTYLPGSVIKSHSAQIKTTR